MSQFFGSGGQSTGDSASVLPMNIQVERALHIIPIENGERKLGFPSGSDGKESACNSGDRGSIPGLGRPPWTREWLPTPIFLLGECHGQRSLASYSPWGRKELDRTEVTEHAYI